MKLPGKLHRERTGATSGIGKDHSGHMMVRAGRPAEQCMMRVLSSNRLMAHLADFSVSAKESHKIG